MNIMMAEEKKSEKGTGIAARLARPNILELQPYRCARDDYSEGVLLDANENALGPTSVPTNSLDPFENHLNLERYPDPYQNALKEKYAAYRGYGLTPANIFCGVGSDEAIDLLMRIFCQPAVDNILITPPSYGMYKVCAKVNDVQVLSCPLSKEFDLRVSEVSYVITERSFFFVNLGVANWLNRPPAHFIADFGCCHREDQASIHLQPR
jgi:histidinol-phosphate aminotransferase